MSTLGDSLVPRLPPQGNPGKLNFTKQSKELETTEIDRLITGALNPSTYLEIGKENIPDLDQVTEMVIHNFNSQNLEDKQIAVYINTFNSRNQVISTTQQEDRTLESSEVSLIQLPAWNAFITKVAVLSILDTFNKLNDQTTETPEINSTIMEQLVDQEGDGGSPRLELNLTMADLERAMGQEATVWKTKIQREWRSYQQAKNEKLEEPTQAISPKLRGTEWLEQNKDKLFSDKLIKQLFPDSINVRRELLDPTRNQIHTISTDKTTLDQTPTPQKTLPHKPAVKQKGTETEPLESEVAQQKAPTPSNTIETQTDFDKSEYKTYKNTLTTLDEYYDSKEKELDQKIKLLQYQIKSRQHEPDTGTGVITNLRRLLKTAIALKDKICENLTEIRTLDKQPKPTPLEDPLTDLQTRLTQAVSNIATEIIEFSDAIKEQYKQSAIASIDLDTLAQIFLAQGDGNEDSALAYLDTKKELKTDFKDPDTKQICSLDDFLTSHRQKFSKRTIQFCFNPNEQTEEKSSNLKTILDNFNEKKQRHLRLFLTEHGFLKEGETIDMKGFTQEVFTDKLTTHWKTNKEGCPDDPATLNTMAEQVFQQLQITHDLQQLTENEAFLSWEEVTIPKLKGWLPECDDKTIIDCLKYLEDNRITNPNGQIVTIPEALTLTLTNEQGDEHEDLEKIKTTLLAKLKEIKGKHPTLDAELMTDLKDRLKTRLKEYKNLRKIQRHIRKRLRKTTTNTVKPKHPHKIDAKTLHHYFDTGHKDGTLPGLEDPPIMSVLDPKTKELRLYTFRTEELSKEMDVEIKHYPIVSKFDETIKAAHGLENAIQLTEEKPQQHLRELVQGLIKACQNETTKDEALEQLKNLKTELEDALYKEINPKLEQRDQNFKTLATFFQVADDAPLTATQLSYLNTAKAVRELDILIKHLSPQSITPKDLKTLITLSPEHTTTEFQPISIPPNLESNALQFDRPPQTIDELCETITNTTTNRTYHILRVLHTYQETCDKQLKKEEDIGPDLQGQLTALKQLLQKKAYRDLIPRHAQQELEYLLLCSGYKHPHQQVPDHLYVYQLQAIGQLTKNGKPRELTKRCLTLQEGKELPDPLPYFQPSHEGIPEPLAAVNSNRICGRESEHRTHKERIAHLTELLGLDPDEDSDKITLLSLDPPPDVPIAKYLALRDLLSPLDPRLVFEHLSHLGVQSAERDLYFGDDSYGLKTLQTYCQSRLDPTKTVDVNPGVTSPQKEAALLVSTEVQCFFLTQLQRDDVIKKTNTTDKDSLSDYLNTATDTIETSTLQALTNEAISGLCTAQLAQALMEKDPCPQWNMFMDAKEKQAITFPPETEYLCLATQLITLLREPQPDIGQILTHLQKCHNNEQDNHHPSPLFKEIKGYLSSTLHKASKITDKWPDGSYEKTAGKWLTVPENATTLGIELNSIPEPTFDKDSGLLTLDSNIKFHLYDGSLYENNKVVTTAPEGLYQSKQYKALFRDSKLFMQLLKKEGDTWAFETTQGHITFSYNSRTKECTAWQTPPEKLARQLVLIETIKTLLTESSPLRNLVSEESHQAWLEGNKITIYDKNMVPCFVLNDNNSITDGLNNPLQAVTEGLPVLTLFQDHPYTAIYISDKAETHIDIQIGKTTLSLIQSQETIKTPEPEGLTLCERPLSLDEACPLAKDFKAEDTLFFKDKLNRTHIQHILSINGQEHVLSFMINKDNQLEPKSRKDATLFLLHHHCTEAPSLLKHCLDLYKGCDWNETESIELESAACVSITNLDPNSPQAYLHRYIAYQLYDTLQFRQLDHYLPQERRGELLTLLSKIEPPTKAVPADIAHHLRDVGYDDYAYLSTRNRKPKKQKRSLNLEATDQLQDTITRLIKTPNKFIQDKEKGLDEDKLNEGFDDYRRHISNDMNTAFKQLMGLVTQAEETYHIDELLASLIQGKMPLSKSEYEHAQLRNLAIRYLLLKTEHDHLSKEKTLDKYQERPYAHLFDTDITVMSQVEQTDLLCTLYCEHLLKSRMRTDQFTELNKLLTGEDRYQQQPTGYGKTEIFMFVLALKHADGNYLTRITTPESLLTQMGNRIDSKFATLFQSRTVRLSFNQDQQENADYLDALLTKIKLIKDTQKILLASRHFDHFLIDAQQELSTKLERELKREEQGNDITKNIEVCLQKLKEIRDYQQKWGIEVIDEPQEVWNKQVSETIFGDTPTPVAKEKVQLTRLAFSALMTIPKVDGELQHLQLSKKDYQAQTPSLITHLLTAAKNDFPELTPYLTPPIEERITDYLTTPNEDTEQLLREALMEPEVTENEGVLRVLMVLSELRDIIQNILPNAISDTNRPNLEYGLRTDKPFAAPYKDFVKDEQSDFESPETTIATSFNIYLRYPELRKPELELILRFCYKKLIANKEADIPDCIKSGLKVLYQVIKDTFDTFSGGQEDTFIESCLANIEHHDKQAKTQPIIGSKVDTTDQLLDLVEKVYFHDYKSYAQTFTKDYTGVRPYRVQIAFTATPNIAPDSFSEQVRVTPKALTTPILETLFLKKLEKTDPAEIALSQLINDMRIHATDKIPLRLKQECAQLLGQLSEVRRKELLENSIELHHNALLQKTTAATTKQTEQLASITDTLLVPEKTGDYSQLESLLNKMVAEEPPPYQFLIDAGAIIKETWNKDMAKFVYEKLKKPVVYVDKTQTIQIYNKGAVRPYSLDKKNYKQGECFFLYKPSQRTGMDTMDLQQENSKLFVTVSEEMSTELLVQSIGRGRFLNKTSGQTVTLGYTEAFEKTLSMNPTPLGLEPQKLHKKIQDHFTQSQTNNLDEEVYTSLLKECDGLLKDEAQRLIDKHGRTLVELERANSILRQEKDLTLHWKALPKEYEGEKRIDALKKHYNQTLAKLNWLTTGTEADAESDTTFDDYRADTTTIPNTEDPKTLLANIFFAHYISSKQEDEDTETPKSRTQHLLKSAYTIKEKVNQNTSSQSRSVAQAQSQSQSKSGASSKEPLTTTGLNPSKGLDMTIAIKPQIESHLQPLNTADLEKLYNDPTTILIDTEEPPPALKALVEATEMAIVFSQNWRRSTDVLLPVEHIYLVEDQLIVVTQEEAEILDKAGKTRLSLDTILDPDPDPATTTKEQQLDLLTLKSLIVGKPLTDHEQMCALLGDIKTETDANTHIMALTVSKPLKQQTEGKPIQRLWGYLASLDEKTTPKLSTEKGTARGLQKLVLETSAATQKMGGKGLFIGPKKIAIVKGINSHNQFTITINDGETVTFGSEQTKKTEDDNKGIEIQDLKSAFNQRAEVLVQDYTDRVVTPLEEKIKKIEALKKEYKKPQHDIDTLTQRKTEIATKVAELADKDGKLQAQISKLKKTGPRLDKNKIWKELTKPQMKALIKAGLKIPEELLGALKGQLQAEQQAQVTEKKEMATRLEALIAEDEAAKRETARIEARLGKLDAEQTTRLEAEVKQLKESIAQELQTWEMEPLKFWKCTLKSVNDTDMRLVKSDPSIMAKRLFGKIPRWPTQPIEQLDFIVTKNVEGIPTVEKGQYYYVENGQKKNVTINNVQMIPHLLKFRGPLEKVGIDETAFRTFLENPDTFYKKEGRKYWAIIDVAINYLKGLLDKKQGAFREELWEKLKAEKQTEEHLLSTTKHTINRAQRERETQIKDLQNEIAHNTEKRTQLKMIEKTLSTVNNLDSRESLLEPSLERIAAFLVKKKPTSSKTIITENDDLEEIIGKANKDHASIPTYVLDREQDEREKTTAIRQLELRQQEGNESSGKLVIERSQIEKDIATSEKIQRENKQLIGHTIVILELSKEDRKTAESKAETLLKSPNTTEKDMLTMFYGNKAVLPDLKKTQKDHNALNNDMPVPTTLTTLTELKDYLQGDYTKALKTRLERLYDKTIEASHGNITYTHAITMLKTLKTALEKTPFYWTNYTEQSLTEEIQKLDALIQQFQKEKEALLKTLTDKATLEEAFPLKEIQNTGERDDYGCLKSYSDLGSLKVRLETALRNMNSTITLTPNTVLHELHEGNRELAQFFGHPIPSVETIPAIEPGFTLHNAPVLTASG